MEKKSYACIMKTTVIYSLLSIFLFCTCAKKKDFPVPGAKNENIVRPTIKSIYKVEIIDANYQNCLPGDADQKPDLYLFYGYTDPIWGSNYYSFTPIKYNVSKASLPVTFVLSTPVDVYGGYYIFHPGFTWKLYDFDGTTQPNTAMDNYLGGYKYDGNSSSSGFGDYSTIGQEGCDLGISHDQKHIFKFYYRWLE